MKLPKNQFRALLSLALAITVTSLFTLRAYAVTEKGMPNDPSGVQDCSGNLTVKSGTVMINGNPAQTGATVTNGSVISTSSGGKAVIDLGAAGRVELGKNTTVTILCAGGTIEVKSSCEKTEVKVISGSAEVKAPTIGTLTAGQKKDYDGAVDVMGSAGINLEIECEGGHKAGGLLVGPGLIGLLALIGVGAAVAVGVAVGNGDTSSTSGEPSSPRN